MILKNMKLQVKMLLNAGVPVALFLILGIVSLFALKILRDNVTELAGSMDNVIEVNRAIEEAGVLHTLLISTESAERAFLISGEETHLAQYKDAADKLTRQFQVVQGLVSSPEQKKRLVDIEAFFAEWQKQAAEPEIAARKKVDSEAIARMKKKRSV